MNDESPKATVTLHGTVQKVMKSPFPNEPEKAQIGVEGADQLYSEIRIENSFQNEEGEDVALKPGAEVDVTVEAPAQIAVEEKA